jgi:hypothetical protein
MNVDVPPKSGITFQDAGYNPVRGEIKFKKER